MEGDRYIAGIDAAAFEVQAEESRFSNSDNSYYRETLTDRMGLGGSVLVYDSSPGASPQIQPMQPSATPSRGATPQHAAPAFRLQMGTMDTPPSSNPHFMADETSPEEPSPGGGDNTPRKQITTSANIEAWSAQASPSTYGNFGTPDRQAARNTSPNPYAAHIASATMSPFNMTGASSTFGRHSPDPQSMASPPQTPMRTPVHRRDIGTSPFGTPMAPPRSVGTPVMNGTVTPQNGWRPRLAPRSSGTPQATTPTQNRREGLTPHRILDAGGVSDDDDTTIMTWGKHALVVGLSTTTYLWTPDSIQVLCESRTKVSAVACSAPDAEEAYVTVGYVDGLIEVFIVSGLESVQRMPMLHDQGMDKVADMAIFRHQLHAVYRDGVYSITDLRDHTSVWRTALDVPLYAVRATDDGNHIAVGTATGVIIFHASSLSAPTIVNTRQSQPVRALAWQPNADVGHLLFATGEDSSELAMYTVGTGIIWSRGAGGRVNSVLWSRVTSGEFIVSLEQSSSSSARHRPGTPSTATAADYPLILFSLSGDRLRRTASFTGHEARILHIALSADGAMVASAAGGRDETLRFWSVFSPKKAELVDDPAFQPRRFSLPSSNAMFASPFDEELR